MNNKRQKSYKYERITSEIKRVIENIIEFDITDPRVCGYAKVTDVIVSKDFSHCKVFVQITSDDKDKVLLGLKNASGYVKHVVSNTLDLRKIPDISFYNDDTYENALRIEELLKKI